MHEKRMQLRKSCSLKQNSYWWFPHQALPNCGEDNPFQVKNKTRHTVRLIHGFKETTLRDAFQTVREMYHSEERHRSVDNNVPRTPFQFQKCHHTIDSQMV